MKSFRLFLSLGGLALLAAGLGGCLKAPEYSTTPSISNNNVRVSRFNPVNPGETRRDSIYITINYQDGDGDLGLSEQESKVAPYAYQNADGTINKFNNNYFIESMVKHPGSTRYVPTTVLNDKTGQQEPLAVDAFNGRFEHITGLTDSKDAPIKGTLTRTLSLGYGDYFSAGDSVRFNVSIADRALHVSNVVRTASIVIAPK